MTDNFENDDFDLNSDKPDQPQAAKKALGESFKSSIFDRVFSSTPPHPQPTLDPQKLEQLASILGPTATAVIVRPITVILGRVWANQAQLLTNLSNDAITKHFTRVMACPETTYHIADLIHEVLPALAQAIREDLVLLIMTGSIPVVEELKRYIREGKLPVNAVSFLYVHADNKVEMLLVNEDGSWVKPYPDSTYEIAAEALEEYYDDEIGEEFEDVDEDDDECYNDKYDYDADKEEKEDDIENEETD